MSTELHQKLKLLKSIKAFKCNMSIKLHFLRCHLPNVIYWPSTELSIKRCTCVNKRKNSGSKWTLNNNITRWTDGSSQLETRCRIENQRQTEGFGPSVTHGWATPAKMRKKCCYGRRRTWGQYCSLSPSPTHLSHTTNITLSRIKCMRYIFIKKCVRSFVIEVFIVFDYVLHVFVLRLYNTNLLENLRKVCDEQRVRFHHDLKFMEERYQGRWGCKYDDWLLGGARGVIVIAVGNEHGDTSSNPGRDWLHFHIALIPLGKVWIQLFSLQLWVNSRAD